MAHALERIEGVQRVDWILEEGDEVWGQETPSSRGRTLTVKNSAEVERRLEILGDIDLGVIANFGLILSQKCISHARKGFVNLHFGLLPDYPGRHPIRQALERGEVVTGLTLHEVTPKPDRGAIIAVRQMSIGARRDPGEVFTRLAAAAPLLLAENLPLILR